MPFVEGDYDVDQTQVQQPVKTKPDKNKRCCIMSNKDSEFFVPLMMKIFVANDAARLSENV